MNEYIIKELLAQRDELIKKTTTLNVGYTHYNQAIAQYRHDIEVIDRQIEKFVTPEGK